MNCPEGSSGDMIAVQESLQGIGIYPFRGKGFKGDGVSYADVEMAEFSADSGSRIAQGAAGGRDVG